MRVPKETDEMVEYNDGLMDGYGDDNVVAPNAGLTGNPLPKSTYPVEVMKAEVEEVQGYGVPVVRIQLRVTEGYYENRYAFVDLFAGAFSSIKVDGQEKMLDKEEWTKRKNEALGKLKMLHRDILEVPVGRINSRVPVEQVKEGAQPHLWEGRKFMADIRVRKDKTGDYPDKNTLGSFYKLDDEKKGLGVWRTKVKDKQKGLESGVSTHEGSDAGMMV